MSSTALRNISVFFFLTDIRSRFLNKVSVIIKVSKNVCHKKIVKQLSEEALLSMGITRDISCHIFFQSKKKKNPVAKCQSKR
jgi:hypothetical protein